MRLNQVAVWVVARASHTSSVRPRLAQFINQARRQIGHVELDAVGNQGKDVRPLRSVFLTVAVPKPPRAKTRQRQGKVRGSRRDAVQLCVRDQQQLAVPQRNNRGAARRFQQPAGLAHQFAVLDLGGQTGLERGLDAQPAAGQQIYSIRIRAGFKKQIAGRQREVHGTGRQGLEAFADPRRRDRHNRVASRLRVAFRASRSTVLHPMPCVCSGREGAFLESNRQYCGVFAWQGKRPLGGQNHRDGGGGARPQFRGGIGGLPRAWTIPPSGSRNS